MTAKTATEKASPLLTAEAIREAGARLVPIRKFEIPELGGHVYVRSPSAGALIDLVELQEEGLTKEALRLIVGLAAEMIVDKQRRPILTNDEARSLYPDTLNRLIAAVTALGEDEVKGEATDDGGREGNA